MPWNAFSSSCILHRGVAVLAGLVLAGASWAAHAADDAPAASAAPSAPSAPSAARAGSWASMPRVTGWLSAADIGVVINSSDPDSVAVGEYYIAARKLKPAQVLRVQLPVQHGLSLQDFQRLQQAIESRFGPRTQALALAWTQPYAVGCNSITGALALGYDGDLCQRSCNMSRPSNYFNSPSGRPWSDHLMRISMLLAGRTVAQAKALIDRGVASDGSLMLRGRPPVNVLLLTTDDVARRVRTVLYPPPGLLRGIGVDVRIVPEAELPGAPALLMAITGSVRPPLIPPPNWVAGGVGDHLTSVGGDLLGAHDQGSALDWLSSGATASHGTVSEPCNHLQKFPHPQVLLGQYLQGVTVIEAYWKSVAWPQQSLFIGEPLAAPFAAKRR